MSSETETKEEVKSRKRQSSIQKLVFGLFQQAKDQQVALPDLAVVTGKVREQFPTSKWLANPKVHYQYYKGKWCQSIGTSSKNYGDDGTGSPTKPKRERKPRATKGEGTFAKAQDASARSAHESRFPASAEGTSEKVWPAGQETSA